MAQNGKASGDDDGLNHTVALDNVPELWTEILKHVPEADRLLRVPLVSRSLSEACRDPSLWSELHVLCPAFRTDARWQSFLRWLAVRAVGLEKFVFPAGGPLSVLGSSRQERKGAAVWVSRIPELLMLLADSAPRLRSLECWYPWRSSQVPDSAMPSELGRFSRLTSLTLGFGGGAATTAQVDTMMQALPLLQHLSLRGYLTGAFPVGIACSCSQLRCLEIRGAQLGAMALDSVPQELGHLTGLTRLVLATCLISSLPDSISQLAQLSELDLQGSGVLRLALPPGLTACRQLTRLAMGSDSGSPELAKLQALRCLEIVSHSQQQPHETYWTQLAALTELRLKCSRRRNVPAGLAGMTSLCKLMLDNAQIDELTAGTLPALSRLESLALRDCALLAWIPAGLAAVTQLRHLSITCSKYHNPPIRLTATDVAVLSSLPQLTILSLQKPASVDQQVWEERVSQLQAACIAKGRSPPAISQCLALVD